MGFGLPVLIEKGAEVAPKCLKVKPEKWAEQSDNRLSVRLSNELFAGYRLVEHHQYGSGLARDGSVSVDTFSD
ncbi:hypothetical protein [Pseudomonas sp.]|uniref:hypothetical protein n=1 Tax=Pseudomonas sp. TaxID=306 RepID=UPI003D6E9B81